MRTKTRVAIVCGLLSALVLGLIATAVVAFWPDGSGTTSAEERTFLLRQDQIASAQESAPGQQAEAVADGVLTFEEYEEAFNNYVACLEDAGMVIYRGPYRTPRVN